MEERLPTDLPDYQAWRAEVLRRIRAATAAADLESLIEQHCDRESLLFRLAGLAAEWSRPTRSLSEVGLTRHKVKVAPKKFRDAAEVVDCLRQLEFFLPPEQSEATDLTILARRLADRVEKSLPLLLRPSHTTLGVAALCGLMGYVKRTTGKYRDEELSALVGAVLGKDGYAAKNLAQWRSKHKSELAELQGCIVSPCSVPSKRT